MEDESTPAADTDAEEPVSPDAGEEPGAETDEDQTRSQRRRRAQEAAERRVWHRLWFGGIVVLVLFLAAFWPVMAGRLTAAKQLDQASAQLDQARGSMATVDKLVDLQLSADAGENVPDVGPEILVARRELKLSVSLLGQAMPHLTEDEQRRGNLIKISAEQRLVMLDRAPTILKVSVKAVRAKNLADAGWLRSQNASVFEARANAAYQKQTAIGVRSAQDLYSSAAGSLLLAKPLYSQAASAFPEADFGGYATYNKQRIVAVRTAENAAVAWLAGNRTKANTLRSAYSASSAKAAETFKTLPSAPGRTTGAAFARVAGGARDAYVSARSQADIADKMLKNL